MLKRSPSLAFMEEDSVVATAAGESTGPMHLLAGCAAKASAIGDFSALLPYLAEALLPPAQQLP